MQRTGRSDLLRGMMLARKVTGCLRSGLAKDAMGREAACCFATGGVASTLSLISEVDLAELLVAARVH